MLFGIQMTQSNFFPLTYVEQVEGVCQFVLEVFQVAPLSNSGPFQEQVLYVVQAGLEVVQVPASIHLLIAFGLEERAR